MTLLRRNAPLSRIFVVTPVLDVGPEKVGELVVLVFGEEGCDFGSDYFFRARGAEIVPGDLVEGLQVLLAELVEVISIESVSCQGAVCGDAFVVVAFFVSDLLVEIPVQICTHLAFCRGAEERPLKHCFGCRSGIYNSINNLQVHYRWYVTHCL